MDCIKGNHFIYVWLADCITSRICEQTLHNKALRKAEAKLKQSFNL